MGGRSFASNLPATLSPVARGGRSVRPAGGANLSRSGARLWGRMLPALVAGASPGAVMPQTRTTNRMIVRTARRGDAGAVAALSAQLGYDEAEDEIGKRIEEIRAQETGEVYVAVVPPDIV